MSYDAIENLDEKMTLEITRDKMFAIASFEEAKDGGRALSLGEIKEQLRQKGVIEGIDENVIDEIGSTRMPSFKYIVARGQKPVDGEMAKLEYHFDVDQIKNFKPAEKADGSVDFKDLHITHNVKADEVLVEKIPATEGIDGFNVLGGVLKARKGKDIRLPKGKNTVITEDGLSLIAMKDGQLIYDRDSITISELFIVEEDVDSSTGNIDFIGSVLVNGSVHTGFTIKAVGNIEVRGSVEDATLIAGGDIILKHGIQGGDKGRLEAKGSVIAKFIQSSNVEAGKDIIAEVVLHSKISAGNAIKVDNGKGSIVGGEALATNFISTNIIGSPMSTATAIRMGISPSLYTQYKDLEKALSQKKEELNKISQSITFLMTKARTSEITPDKQHILEKLIHSKATVAKQYDETLKEYQEIQETLTNAQNGAIKVKDIVYQGVKISIGNAVRYITEEAKFCTIQKIDGDIEIGPY